MSQTDVSTTQQPAFFAIGLFKLAVLLIGTMGLAQLYWLFAHWHHLRESLGLRVNLAARVILCPFISVFSLAYRFGAAAQLHAVWGPTVALAMASLWDIGLVVPRLIHVPLPINLLALFSPLIALQAIANRANRLIAPNHDANKHITRRNLLVMVPGALMWTLIILGELASLVANGTAQR